MQRALFILLGLIAATTVAGLLLAFARPSRWPSNLTAPEWRRTLGEKIEHDLDRMVEEAAA